MNAKYKILLVDDEISLRELIAETLVDGGYEVTQANDGVEAKTLLEKLGFNLMITDLRMPNMDGTQLLEWCRRSSIHFPVIFITASSELLPSDNLALQDCCVAVLNKPFNLQEILVAIDQAKLRNHNLNC